MPRQHLIKSVIICSVLRHGCTGELGFMNFFDQSYPKEGLVQHTDSAS